MPLCNATDHSLSLLTIGIYFSKKKWDKYLLSLSSPLSPPSQSQFRQPAGQETEFDYHRPGCELQYGPMTIDRHLLEGEGTDM
jgi:hypothetical protein